VNPQMAALDEEAKKAGIVVMNEIGVDPGIDHLYAVKKIEEVHNEGGKILEFISYCGGLPAPENSNNPLGYKFSWSSRGVLLALRNSAKFIQGGKVAEIDGAELMRSAKPIFTGYPGFAVVGYPNRDSSPYNKRYNIPEAQTVIRGTLRYQGFPQFVQVLVDGGYLDDKEQEHLKESSAEKLTWKQLSATLLGCKSTDADEILVKKLADKAGLNKLPESERNHIVLGFKWLGLFSEELVEKRGTLLDCLCAKLEKKMQYEEGERDMVLLQHTFIVEKANGQKETHLSTLLEFGEPAPKGTTAMAKTVGVPCGIAVQLVLDGVLNKTGVIAPMTMDICQPLIDALAKEGIVMKEEVIA